MKNAEPLYKAPKRERTKPATNVKRKAQSLEIDSPLPVGGYPKEAKQSKALTAKPNHSDPECF
jgi:hypothetical protein